MGRQYVFRNKDKQFRPINGSRPLELALGNGCYGIKSNFGIRVYIPGPKKGRRNDKGKKNSCKLWSKGNCLRSETDIPYKVADIRRQLLTLRMIGDFHNKEILTPEIGRILTLLTQWLLTNHYQIAQVEFYRDQQRERSLTGRLAKTTKPDDIGNIRRTFDRAKFVFNML